MRLLIARQDTGLGQLQESLSACRRASASSGECGRPASTASIISAVVPVGALQQQPAKPLGDEVIDFIGDGGPMHGLRGGGFVEQLGEVEIQSALEQDAQYAERGAAQAERVLGAGGALLDREDADEGIDLVGERERLTGLGRGQRVARVARPVVLLDGERQLPADSPWASA